MPGFMAQCLSQHPFTLGIEVTWPSYARWLMIQPLCEPSHKPEVISQNAGSSAKGAFAFSQTQRVSSLMVLLGLDTGSI